ncbi:3'-5' exonuclease [Patescibacteria group bacterium]|nr:3'-5' exonuclease [Patescibacteria group bacterium]
MLPNFTIFDVETTGLDPRRGHKIIELAALRIEGGQILTDAPFNSFVNPERTIPAETAQINHISNDDVIGAPTIDQVLPMFLDFAKESILVAHNAAFDMGFLNIEKENCWGYIEIPEAICTMRLSQSIFPNEFRHNLDIVSMRLGLEMPTNRHRALPDVLLTAQALLKMIEAGKIESVEDLMRRAGKKKIMA